jgi:hypothetical protein
MKTIIETTITNDVNKESKTWSVILDTDQLAQIAKATGIDSANTALEKFVLTFVDQFKRNLGAYINR